MPKQFGGILSPKVVIPNTTNMSDLFRLGLPDWVKGVVMAVLGAVLTTLEQAISTGGFATVDWMVVLNVGVVAGISYLLKNVFTDSNGRLFGAI